MARSIKKGPYIDHNLESKVLSQNEIIERRDQVLITVFLLPSF